MMAEGHSWTSLSSPYLSFLSGSTRNLNNGRRCSYGSKKKKAKAWIPDKKSREWRERKVVTPECFCEGSTVFKAFGFSIKDFGDDKWCGFPTEFWEWRKREFLDFSFPSLGEGESTIKGALPPYNLLKNNKQKIRTHWRRKGIFLRVRSNCDKCQEMDDRISTPPEAKVLAREYYFLP